MTRLSFRLSLKTLLLGVAIVVAAIVGAWYWHRSQLYQSTDDAYVNARVVQVSSLVMGQVLNVPIHDNQFVHRSDVLFEIDRRPFEAAVGEAEGRLRQAQQGNRQDQSDLLAAQADVAQQQATLTNAEANLRRTSELVRENFMSKQTLDDARARLNAAKASVDAAKARVEKAREALAKTPAGVTPAVRIAQAQLDKARLDVEHTVMRAPEDGWITRFDLTTGTVVTPGNPLFAIVVANSFWVDANFKETELAGVVPGRAATVVVDMYPDHAFHGKVESLAGGTGAAFSLLPPQNANGNWVKVAQRVPVRVSVDDPDTAHPLRVGATATVTVSVAH
ncbi:MAG TPA: HlyD family secretion protein [Casimicrobiaceae bacterium]|nr:HlyD family secretion protein [Casimicrobiaceae bacterium]